MILRIRLVRRAQPGFRIARSCTSTARRHAGRRPDWPAC